MTNLFSRERKIQVENNYCSAVGAGFFARPDALGKRTLRNSSSNWARIVWELNGTFEDGLGEHNTSNKQHPYRYIHKVTIKMSDEYHTPRHAQPTNKTNKKFTTYTVATNESLVAGLFCVVADGEACSVLPSAAAMACCRALSNVS